MARLTGRGVAMRAFPVAVVWTVLVCLAACTPGTTVRVTVDLDSYVEAEFRAASAIVPTVQPLVVYLLPGLQIDDADSGPDENMAAGSLVSLPSFESYAGAQPTVILDVEAVVANQDVTDAMPGLGISVVVAAGDAVNIYDAGTAVVDETFPALAAGQTSSFAVRATLGPESEAYGTLLSGAFRIGIAIRLDANSSTPIPVRVRLSTAEATLEFVPFGLLPPGGPL